MKKLMLMLAGLAFVLGTTATFAQETPKEPTKKSGKKKGGKKKKEETPKKEGSR